MPFSPLLDGQLATLEYYRGQSCYVLLANDTAAFAYGTGRGTVLAKECLNSAGYARVPVSFGAAVEFASGAQLPNISVNFSNTGGATYQADCALLLVGGSATANKSVTSVSSNTITIASHGLSNGDRVSFSSTGSLYSGMTAGTLYFVIAATINTFQISATSGGSAIALGTTGLAVCHYSNGFILGYQRFASAQNVPVGSNTFPVSFSAFGLSKTAI